jgi:hypothetical protein
MYVHISCLTVRLAVFEYEKKVFDCSSSSFRILAQFFECGQSFRRLVFDAHTNPITMASKHMIVAHCGCGINLRSTLKPHPSSGQEVVSSIEYHEWTSGTTATSWTCTAHGMQFPLISPFGSHLTNERPAPTPQGVILNN